MFGSLTGIWAANWITFWGVVLFKTLVITGTFEGFHAWLTTQGTADVRVQALLFAWAFGARLEGLVGFGYPWAVVAPILIAVAPIVGWIGVALSGSNTSTKPMLGAFRAAVGERLGFPLPPLLLPSLNSVGAEIGKPIVPQRRASWFPPAGSCRTRGRSSATTWAGR